MSDIIFKEIAYGNIKRNTYFVSEDGQVYSKAHNKILKWKYDKKGYALLTLATDDGKNKEFFVAHLVIYTYVGLPPETMVDPTVDHKNNRKLDNHFSNLQWLERIDNCKKINAIKKLTEEEVHNICKMLKQNINPNRISKSFGVSAMTIYKIKQHKTWVNISSQYKI